MNKVINEYEYMYFKIVLCNVAEDSKLDEMAKYIQHGDTSCLLHCIAVAYICNKIAFFVRFMSFHKPDLIRGALLHDYFLYDWHEHRGEIKWHGLSHPMAALKNADNEFELSKIERDVIKKHMFPLTPKPPRYKESLLVSMIDKACAVYELAARHPYCKRNIMFLYNRLLEQSLSAAK